MNFTIKIVIIWLLKDINDIRWVNVPALWETEMPDTSWAATPIPWIISIAIHTLNDVLRGTKHTGPMNRNATDVNKTPMITIAFPLISSSHRYPQNGDDMAKGPPWETNIKPTK